MKGKSQISGHKYNGDAENSLMTRPRTEMKQSAKSDHWLLSDICAWSYVLKIISVDGVMEENTNTINGRERQNPC